MSNLNQGICHICGKKAKLTYDHVPPESVFNDRKIKAFSVEEVFIKNSNRRPWDKAGLNYKILQRGAGFYSLCESCNSNTGSWYVAEYCMFARTLAKMLLDHKEEFKVNEYINFSIQQIKPLAIIKQMFSMFCSINTKNFADENLRKFLLNYKNNDLDQKKYHLSMYLTNSSGFGYASKTLIFKDMQNPFYVSEITAFPIGLILYINLEPSYVVHGTDITCFTDCTYDADYDLKIYVPLYEKNTHLPLDYRSKEEIENTLKA